MVFENIFFFKFNELCEILTSLFLSHPVELLFFQTGGKIPCAETQLQRLIADLKAGGKRLASDHRPFVELGLVTKAILIWLLFVKPSNTGVLPLSFLIYVSL